MDYQSLSALVLACFVLFSGVHGPLALAKPGALTGSERWELGEMLTDAGPVPSPGLSPAEVVRIQMDALGRNNSQDDGIRTTYKFASPGNKQMTGPYPRFAQMIKSAPYRAMLNTQAVSFGELVVRERQAAQAVLVESVDGKRIRFLFFLRRQTAGACQDCWMTEAVVVQPAEDDDDYDHGPDGVGKVMPPAPFDACRRDRQPG
jgi:hypothetical protein